MNEEGDVESPPAIPMAESIPPSPMVESIPPSPATDCQMSVTEDDDAFETLRAEGIYDELEVSKGEEAYIEDTENNGKAALFETKSEETESSDNMVFHPPVYIQRYLAVCEVLKNLIAADDNQNPRSVFEVGCAEFKMLTYFKHMPFIEKIVFMDIDEALLDERKYLLRPLPMEHVIKRETPLVVEAYAGSIVKVDQRILDLEPKLFSVIAIEVIEHLHEDVLEGFEKSVFGVIKPPIVIITTPNSDFNVLFDLAPGKFRHWDHKFEWSRVEFDAWCKKICLQYPYYSYSVDGIGSVAESVDLGCVSQIAIFQKQSVVSTDFKSQISLSGIVECGAYKPLASVEFPFFKDETPDDERILRELQYYLNCYVFNKTSVEDYEEEEVTQIRYPLQTIQTFSGMPNSAQDVTFLKGILEKGGYVIEEDANGEFFAVLQIPSYQDDHVRSDDEEDSQAFLDDYEALCQTASKVSVDDTSTDTIEEESWE